MELNTALEKLTFLTTIAFNVSFRMTSVNTEENLADAPSRRPPPADCELSFIREAKHDVYGKRQTAKMKLLSSLFYCVYSGVKLSVFAMGSRRRYYIFMGFIYGLEEKN